jgi:hypothetical protein
MRRINLCSMNHQQDPPLSDLTPEEQRMRAVQYRQMAASTSAADTRDTLIQLAEMYEALAVGAVRRPANFIRL